MAEHDQRDVVTLLAREAAHVGDQVIANLRDRRLWSSVERVCEAGPSVQGTFGIPGFCQAIGVHHQQIVRLQVAPSRFKRMWQEKQLSGQAQAPVKIATAPQLLAKIASDPGAIGFALAAELPQKPIGVRLITLR
jgi:hypothetical protein